MKGHHALTRLRTNGGGTRNKLTIGDDISLQLKISKQGVLGDYKLLYYNNSAV